jgi:alkanesulfonate monooxygenase SsuD/methylene tetrahydromethanopterin reductase-like flavin-dependent oxidoreductase (luciferase family)
VGPETAAWAAQWADGLVTVGTDPEALSAVVGAYRDAGGRGPAMLQVHLSFAATEDEALQLAHDQWRAAAVGQPAAWDLDSVAAFDAATADVPVADMRDKVLIAVDLPETVARIQALGDVGFDTVYLHHVGKEQQPFIDAFGEQVLPALKETR